MKAKDRNCRACGKMFSRTSNNDMFCSLRCRFSSKIDKSPGQGPNGDCWFWTGAVAGYRYGHLSINGGVKKAHRVAYELFVGPIPPGMRVLHQCDAPLCVRTDHLFLGTMLDNTLDMVRKGRHGRLKLSASDRQWIFWLYTHGATQRELAKSFGVSSSRVSQLVNQSC